VLNCMVLSPTKVLSPFALTRVRKVWGRRQKNAGALCAGTFNDVTRYAAWDRMSQAGAQLMTWFGVACELHRDWRNDVEGLAMLFSNHISDYRNLMVSHSALKSAKK
jgi:hypothetical protein